MEPADGLRDAHKIKIIRIKLSVCSIIIELPGDPVLAHKNIKLIRIYKSDRVPVLQSSHILFLLLKLDQPQVHF